MTEQNAREAMEVWRDVCKAMVRAIPDDRDQAAAAVIAAKLAEKDAEIANIRKACEKCGFLPD